MYRGLSVAVVIPAFNERAAIAATVGSVPEFVDHVLVVDDASSDGTSEAAAAAGNDRLEILRHPINRGVGAAIVTGYRRALEVGADVAAVMAGDGQMDPADLPGLLGVIADGSADHAKGNRFTDWAAVRRVMPPSRLVGNILLSMMTRATSGFWHVFDSQCGYTATTRQALERIDLGRMFARYGYPNDLLARLNTAGQRVVDVPVRPIYGPAWRSGISLSTVVYPIGFVLLRSLARRLWETHIRGRARP